VVLSHIPDNRGNIVHALVIGNNDQGFVIRDVLIIYKGIPGSKQVGTPHQYQIEIAHTFLMGIVAKPVQAYPLDGMENKQANSKNKEVQSC
jgi:hypothetical protein